MVTTLKNARGIKILVPGITDDIKRCKIKINKMLF